VETDFLKYRRVAADTYGDQGPGISDQRHERHDRIPYPIPDLRSPTPREDRTRTMNSIDNNLSSSAARTYVQNADAGRAAQANRGQQADTAPRANRADSVELSSNARRMAAARDAVQNAPDVRQEKVDAIKQRIESGTYEVPARVLARKMLDQSS
jgi:negative regulator of flagellin synthesis FlgM